MGQSALTLVRGPKGDPGEFSASLNDQTGTSYTLQDSDKGKLVTLSNASPITLNVPAGLATGFFCNILQKGAGQVTITAISTTVHNADSATKTEKQWALASIIQIAANTYVTDGRLVT